MVPVLLLPALAWRQAVFFGTTVGGGVRRRPAPAVPVTPLALVLVAAAAVALVQRSARARPAVLTVFVLPAGVQRYDVHRSLDYPLDQWTYRIYQLAPAVPGR